MEGRSIKASKESIQGLLDQLTVHGYVKHAKLISEVLKDDFAEARKTLNNLNQEYLDSINS